MEVPQAQTHISVCGNYLSYDIKILIFANSRFKEIDVSIVIVTVVLIIIIIKVVILAHMANTSVLVCLSACAWL